MNQRDVKALIFIFTAPLFGFLALCEFILIAFKVIGRASNFFVNLHIDKTETDGDYQSAASKKWDIKITLILMSVIIGAAIMKANKFLSFWEGVGLILSVYFCIFVIYQGYAYLYFKGIKFNSNKILIEEHTKNCNELNEHLSDLNLTNLNFSSYDYGDGILNDQSNFRFRRQEWSKIDKGTQIHNCSSAVLKNANNQPFKYLCKYFDVKVNEETLSAIECSLNDVLAANQGRLLLEKERERILTEIENPFPFLILRFSKDRLIRNLGFDPIALNEIYYPEYTFRYVSPGGNSSYDFSIKLNIENLEKFIIYLGDIINFKKTVQGQRALMTQSLRERIKCRDNYTCKICGVSVMDEKNLLLEIDHIIPLSKGGVTSENNLQTLCWRCNRSKGAQIL